MRRAGSGAGREGAIGREEASTCSLSCEYQSDYVLSFYRGTSSLPLSHVNDLVFKESKVFDMLEQMSPKRRIRCGCVKSNCEAKYCECYRAGETCGDACGCVGCKNRRVHRPGPVQREALSGCNCVKSGCLKKYCECFQNGRKCGTRCKCTACRNAEDSA